MITIGRIGNVYGVQGWLKVSSHTERKESLFNYPHWQLYSSSAEGSPSPAKSSFTKRSVEVQEWQRHGQIFIVHLLGVDDRTLAMDYIGCDIHITPQQLPTLPTEEYYWHQLIGLNVYTTHNGQQHYLGQVNKLLATGSNDVLQVDPNHNSIDGRTRLIPWLPEMIIKQVQLTEQQIIVCWDIDF